MVTPAAGDGRLRASHDDREHVVEVLKAAFVQGRLTQDELDTRVGQALAARTYADLAGLTCDLPADPGAARTPAPAPATAAATAPASAARPRNAAAYRAVKTGAGAIAATIIAVTIVAVAVGQPQAAAVLAVIITIFAALTTAFVAALISVVLKVESRRHHRSRGKLPPGPASGASPRPPSPGPARPPRRRPPGLLAVERGSPALSRGGRTDRGLAAGHGRTKPARLVLAGQAGCLR
jgi:hypothetical protein